MLVGEDVKSRWAEIEILSRTSFFTALIGMLYLSICAACSTHRTGSFLRGSEACWVIERGQLAQVKQMEMQCVCMCGAAASGRSQTAADLSAPPSEAQSGAGQIPHTDEQASNISPSHHLCASLFGRLLCHCFHPLILRALFIFLDSKHNFLPLLSFTVFSPLPQTPPTLQSSFCCFIFAIGIPADQQMLGREGGGRAENI